MPDSPPPAPTGLPAEVLATFRQVVGTDLAAADLDLHLGLGARLAKETQAAVQRVPITTDLARGIKGLLADTLRRRARDLAAGDLVLRPYQALTKPDPHEVEVLELATHPSIARQVEALASPAGLPDFRQDARFVAGLRFAVAIAEPPQAPPICLFRTMNPKKELQRSRALGMVLHKGAFDLLRDHVYLLDAGIDCAASAGTLFIFQKTNFQTIFGFYEEVERIARETLETIRARDLIVNFEEFEQACLGHQAKLAKLRNIAASAYFGKITIADLKAVATEFRRQIAFREANGREQLVFDGRDKWEILRLLDDDFLASALTGLRYEVNSKRTL